MRKKIFLSLGVFFAGVSVNAQISDTAFAVASYQFLYMADTTKPTDISSEKMVLYLGKQMSAYRSYERVLRDSEMKAQASAMELQFQAGGTITFPVAIHKGSSDAVYKDFAQVKLFRVEKLQKEYLLEEEIPMINWNIEQETKKIQELSCQKATASFRGRNYTVWFCSELPYSNGPWKLGGLPGLIVEAADDKNEVVFKFAGYENIDSKQIPLVLPKDAIKATAKEFKQLREVADKDPAAFILNNQRPGFKWITPPANPRALIQQASKNPIELILN